MPIVDGLRRGFGTGGPWGTGLLVLGVACAAQGVSYMTTPRGELRTAMAMLADIFPMWAWGGLWVAVGLFAVRTALSSPQDTRDVWPVAGLISLWSGAYLAYWLLTGFVDGQWTRAWASAVAWGSLAALIISWGRCVNPPERRR